MLFDKKESPLCEYNPTGTNHFIDKKGAIFNKEKLNFICPILTLINDTIGQKLLRTNLSGVPF